MRPVGKWEGEGMLKVLTGVQLFGEVDWSMESIVCGEDYRSVESTVYGCHKGFVGVWYFRINIEKFYQGLLSRSEAKKIRI